jgi:hypothetical protein
MGKTALSFYCDDTGPYQAGPKAFQDFLDYCAKNGVKGESSVILGGGRKGSMVRNPDAGELAYIDLAKRARACGIDAHFELMTHWALFDFTAGREKSGTPHEGLWLYEPAVTQDEYEDYFGSIIAEGERVGIKFTGMTWPGCSCAFCDRRYGELRANGPISPNPNMARALLSLTKKGKFDGPTVPCFFESDEEKYGCNLLAGDGEHAVYDLMPNAGDKFGSWGNGKDYVDPDYYITADGKSGIVVKHVAAGAPYCLFYAHWQGLNPGNGYGWPAFTAVVERIRTHLANRVVWMRPSEITTGYHRAGNWSFLSSAG